MDEESFSPKSVNQLPLTYRGKNFDDYKMAASKIVANVKSAELSKIITGIYNIWQVKKTTTGYIVYDDCKHLRKTNFRDYQNLLFRLVF